MNREMLKLAGPNILSNVSVPLISSVDTLLMGHLTALHIGAIGVGSMIFNFIYWNFGFLRMGTTGLTAQAYGRQDQATIMHTLGRGMLVVMILAFLLLLLQYPLAEASIYLLNISSEQRPLVEEYFYIRIWAAPATLASYAIMGWFFGMQNVIFPLILTLVVNITNMVVSWILVRQYGMETAGVAYGTLVAQYLGLLVAGLLFWGRYRTFLLHFHHQAMLQWKALRAFLSLNADIFVRTFCLTFAFGFFYSQSASEGALILAANVILLQFLNWMSYGVDGFAFAAESLVGKYAGANDRNKTAQAIRLSFGWGMGLAILYALVYGFAGDALLQLFTNKVAVLDAAKPFLIWMVIFPLLSTPCYIWDGVFIGLTAAKAMRNSMLLSLAVYLALYLLTQGRYGNHGLWLALLLFMVARGGFQGYLFWREGVALR
ncbi:MAG: MATE family efflux transporter [Saprospiraceae bacterium]